jgi:hypothetical protein
VAQEEADGVAAAVGFDERGQLRDDVGGNARPAVVNDERRLVQRQLGDAGAAACGLERERRPGRDAPHVRRSACLLDQRLEVFDLACDAVGRRVAALAAAAPVVRENRESLREERGKRSARPHSAMAECAVDQDQRRPLPKPGKRDRRPIP